MTAFLTICALTRPRISVRKSSRRSDQRRPPRATGPKRRCTPSTRGEYTQISNFGPRRGQVRRPGCGSSLNDERRRLGASRRRPSPARCGSSWCAASPGSAPSSERRMRSWSRLRHVVQRAVDLLDQRVASQLARSAVAAVRRVEAAPRTARPAAGRSRRWSTQRLLDVALAERGAGLAQVLGVGAQHVGLPPGQPGAQDQRVEAVLLDARRATARTSACSNCSRPRSLRGRSRRRRLARRPKS